MEYNRIYFDHNATTEIDKNAFLHMERYFYLAMNPSSIHSYGREARGLLEEARMNIASSIGVNLAKNASDIIFTSSGTEANNLLLSNFKLKPILVCATEHPSILRYAESCDKMQIIKVDHNGILDLDHLRKILSHQTERGVVTVALANNETGVIQQIDKISDIVHEFGFLLHTDCSQAYGKIDFKLNDFGADFATISGHKIGALAGSAALIIPFDYDLKPIILGGGQEKSRRSGTENMLAILSLGMVANNIKDRVGQNKNLQIIRDYIEDEISKFAQDAVFFGKNVQRIPNTSYIMMPRVYSDLQLIKFDLAGIAVSSGSACSSGRINESHVLKAMNIDNESLKCSVRVSLGIRNNINEAEIFINEWKKIYQLGDKK